MFNVWYSIQALSQWLLAYIIDLYHVIFQIQHCPSRFIACLQHAPAPSFCFSISGDSTYFIMLGGYFFPYSLSSCIQSMTHFCPFQIQFISNIHSLTVFLFCMQSIMKARLCHHHVLNLLKDSHCTQNKFQNQPCGYMFLVRGDIFGFLCSPLCIVYHPRGFMDSLIT